MTSLLSLSETQFWIVALICLLAGIVRGFSGFALSALVMASAALTIPPIELIPVCWWLELCAGFMMIRSGRVRTRHRRRKRALSFPLPPRDCSVSAPSERELEAELPE